MGKERISAFVVCCNEEKQIRRCLESIKWCDEIIIIDSGSTDKTLDICREYTNQIFHKDWAGYVEQKRFALEKCNYEWILNIDADEVVTQKLKSEIQKELEGTSADGYLILRTVFHMGQWWTKGGWHPEFRLRVCRRDKTTWGGLDPHERAVVSGDIRKLSGALEHYSYNDIADQISRINRYSTTLANNLYAKGDRSSALKIVFNPLLRFFKFYIFKKGFLEGFPGVAMAITDAFYVFLKYLKLWEIENVKKNDQRPKKD